jgi:D-alanyl-D-alanine carboxypeptidase
VGGKEDEIGEQRKYTRAIRRTTIISRRRFLKQTALATGMVSVPYLAGKTVAFGKENARGADAALGDLVAMNGGPPGVIAIVQRGLEREVHSFGVRNLKGDLPMRARDLMRIASAAKAFSGAVVLSLVSKGALSYERHDRRAPVRLAKAASRRLGAGYPQAASQPHQRPAGLLAGPGLPRGAAGEPQESPPPEKLLTYVYDHDPTLLFDPGSEYKYSNSDNIVVALMVEAATGMSYEDQLRERVYRPLGLRKTSLPRGPNLRKPFIHGYDNDPSQQPPEDLSEVVAAGWAWASGSIVSTPADLNDFIRGYVGGKLFDERTRAKQRRVVEGGSSEPPGPGKNSAGLGIFRYETRCGTVWGHTGNTPGYTQFMAASPNGSRSVTVSVNTQLTPTDGEPGVFEALRRAEGLAVCAALAGT